jgi:hypothetical protein
MAAVGGVAWRPTFRDRANFARYLWRVTRVITRSDITAVTALMEVTALPAAMVAYRSTHMAVTSEGAALPPKNFLFREEIDTQCH